MHSIGKRLNPFSNAFRSLHHPRHVAHRPTVHCLPTRWPRRPAKSAIRSAFRSIATQQIPGVHYIRLPHTRKGRKAAKEATDYWRAQWKILNQQEPPRLEQDLYFLLDVNPSTKSSILCPNSIIFATTDELGLKLWRIANPIPWSKRPRIIRWPVYGYAIYYGGLLLSWLYCHEEEPVTGRWQLKWMSRPGVEKAKQSQRQAFSAEMQAAEGSAAPDSYPTSQLIRSVLNRLTAAAGLDGITWEFHFIDAPGKLLATWHIHPRHVHHTYLDLKLFTAALTS